MLTTATALSARGKFLDASRTQRLRNADTDRSVLGMAAAALALATAEDDGADDARAQIAELAAAAQRAVEKSQFQTRFHPRAVRTGVPPARYVRPRAGCRRP